MRCRETGVQSRGRQRTERQAEVGTEEWRQRQAGLNVKTSDRKPGGDREPGRNTEVEAERWRKVDTANSLTKCHEPSY